MSRSNRWIYFLLVFICKATDTSTSEVSDFTHQEFNISKDYHLNYTNQEHQTAFLINEDSQNISRRLSTTVPPPIDQSYVNCGGCGIANTKKTRSPRRAKFDTSEITRIYGGKEVEPHRKYPWQVGIFNKKHNAGLFVCGGSIINDRWILTAAHCILNFENCIDKNNPKYQRWVNKRMKIRVGEHKQSIKDDDDDANTKVYRVAKWIIHPSNECPITKEYDFALLKLKDKISFNNVIRPVCLPDNDSKTYAGITGIVSGWGKTQSDVWSDELKELNYRISANTACKVNFRPKGDITNTHICAGPVAYEGPCFGDSGGPLIVKEGNRHIQVGVVSFGPENCGTPNSAVFGRVSKVLNWIKEKTSRGGKCKRKLG